MSAVQEVKVEVDEDTEQYKTYDVTPAFHQEPQTAVCELPNRAVPFVSYSTADGDVPSVSNEYRQQTNALSSAVISNEHHAEDTYDMKDSDGVLCSVTSYMYDLGDPLSSAVENATVQQKNEKTSSYICNICHQGCTSPAALKNHLCVLPRPVYRNFNIERNFKCPS